MKCFQSLKHEPNHKHKHVKQFRERFRINTFQSRKGLAWSVVVGLVMAAVLIGVGIFFVAKYGLQTSTNTLSCEQHGGQCVAECNGEHLYIYDSDCARQGNGKPYCCAITETP